RKLVGFGRHASEGGVQHVSPQRLEGAKRSGLVLLQVLQRRDQQEVDRSPQLTPRSRSVATSLSCPWSRAAHGQARSSSAFSTSFSSNFSKTPGMGSSESFRAQP